MENRNVITADLIAEASVCGKVRVEGLYSGHYRKPVFRKGAWYVRDHGWRKILSFRRLGRTSINFDVQDFVIYASSREIEHDGGDRPAWLDERKHKVYAELFKKGRYGLWSDIESFYVGARCIEDIPAEFREDNNGVAAAA